MSSWAIEYQGLDETRAALQGVEADLAETVAGELRTAGAEASRELASQLVAAASSCGVPVAPLVARSIRPFDSAKAGVSIGGTMPVGRYGAIAAKLLWGSEHGPAGEPNHFAVAPSAGYWIAPTVKAFKNSDAQKPYEKAIATIIAKHHLD
jgi:hypothetical protein